ncbi:MAG: ATP-binding protein [Oscillospiraceae bacterium]|nr:ATP-binding protein [Oscillospiraceae bacterium]
MDTNENREKLRRLADGLSYLAVFRGLLRLTTMSSLHQMLSDPTPDTVGEFVYNLYRHRGNLSDYILRAAYEDENPYIMKKARRENVPFVMERAVDNELALLEQVSMVTPADVRAAMGDYFRLPEWENTKRDFREMYKKRLDELFTKGTGIFAKYTVFMIRGKELVPVLSPDPQKLSDLHEYEVQRKQVEDNTIALLNGLPAANCLLYGDSGTGKSSTVKAIANKYADMGLRLIELKKPQLHMLPEVLERISEDPLKFIIFIDDLSFSSGDEDFSTLKAALEGSAAARAANTVIYATSNRRHLVRESFSARMSDDIHAGDTRQELASLSERFGLKVTFLKPDKDTYLSIVSHLADKYGIDTDREKLFEQAESYALRRNGRSGRAAKQFVESLAAGGIEHR